MLLFSFFALAEAYTLRSEQCIPDYKSCHFIQKKDNRISVCTVEGEQENITCSSSEECSALYKTATCSPVSVLYKQQGDAILLSFEYEINIDFHQSYAATGIILSDHQAIFLTHTIPTANQISETRTTMIPVIQDTTSSCEKLSIEFDKKNADFQSCAEMTIREFIEASNSENYQDVVNRCTDDLKPIVLQAKQHQCDLSGLIFLTIGQGYENIDMFKVLSK